MTADIVITRGEACAHHVVRFDPVDTPDGLKRDRWTCDTCHGHFNMRGIAALEARCKELEEINERWRVDQSDLDIAVVEDREEFAVYLRHSLINAAYNLRERAETAEARVKELEAENGRLQAVDIHGVYHSCLINKHPLEVSIGKRAPCSLCLAEAAEATAAELRELLNTPPNAIRRSCRKARERSVKLEQEAKELREEINGQYAGRLANEERADRAEARVKELEAESISKIGWVSGYELKRAEEEVAELREEVERLRLRCSTSHELVNRADAALEEERVRATQAEERAERLHKKLLSAYVNRKRGVLNMDDEVFWHGVHRELGNPSEPDGDFDAVARMEKAEERAAALEAWMEANPVEGYGDHPTEKLREIVDGPHLMGISVPARAELERRAALAKPGEES